MKTVPRIGRILDLGALLVFLAGGLVYARAWLGLRDIEGFERPAGAEPFAATELADGFRRSGQLGLALMVAGVVGFLAAWWIARRMMRRD